MQEDINELVASVVLWADTTFEKMIEARKAKGKKCGYETGEEVFNWWIEEYKHNVKGQMSLFEDDGQENVSE